MSAEIVKLLWEFLSPILSDRLKERLKIQGSPEIAQKRAYHLYKILGEVEQTSDEFVKALQVAADPNQIIDGTTFLDISEKLAASLQELSESLLKLDPQLSIHQYELVKTIESYRGRRDFVIGKARAEIAARLITDDVAKMNDEKISKIAKQATANQKLIRKAIQDFRSFLAAEFPFKESF